MTHEGVLTTLHSFTFSDGYAPLAGLVQATDGNFYGTTYEGGGNSTCGNGCGTVFKITPAGVLTTLHTFNFTDGADPNGVLIQAADGNLYGTTANGGSGSPCPVCGTAFKITLEGILTTIYNFDTADGIVPLAGLLQATDENFYGTTSYGGDGDCTVDFGGCGTVFRLTPTGSFTT